MRPEAEQRLRAGFQRRVDKQHERYAPELAHAAQLAAGSGCGQLAAAGIPGMLPAFGGFLFGFIAWYGVTLWRGIRRPRGDGGEQHRGVAAQDRRGHQVSYPARGRRRGRWS